MHKMSNAFSPNYKPQINMDSDLVSNKMSRIQSMRRKDRMDSDDPAVRKAASGTLGVLSGIKENKAIIKNSKLG